MWCDLETKRFCSYLAHCRSSAEAIKKIYEIKGRQETKPLAICVADVLEIPRFASTEHLPPGLLDSLLPGPVTVVLRRGLMRFPPVSRLLLSGVFSRCFSVRAFFILVSAATNISRRSYEPCRRI